MADDATAMDEQQEEDEEEEEEEEDDEDEVEGDGDGEEDVEDEEDEGEGEDDEELKKKDVTLAPTPTPTPPSLQHQQDAGLADLSCPILSSTPPIPSAPGPPAVCKELQQVEVELRLLEALEVYHPSKLLGMHRHFILYGLMEYLERRLNHHFTSEEILELLDRFYNLELLKPDEEEMELLSQEEEFSLPASILAVKEEPRGSS